MLQKLELSKLHIGDWKHETELTASRERNVHGPDFLGGLSADVQEKKLRVSRRETREEREFYTIEEETQAVWRS